MNRLGMRNTLLVGAALLVALAPARADVKSEHKSKFEMAGVMGAAMKMFGGKAAREGVVTMAALKGDRMMSRTEKSGELIDLNEEKVYQVNFDKKTYTVKTFAQIRAEMEEEMRKAREQQAKQQNKEKPDPNAPEYEVDFDIKETGNHERIGNYDTREVLMTITVRQKGKKLEDGGGGVLAASMWMGPKLPGLDEVIAFQKRYAEKLHLMDAANARDMLAALAMYPGLKAAMEKLREKQVNMQGTPIRTVMTFDAVSGKEETAQANKQQQEEDSPPPTSIGGLFGKLGKKMASKKSADSEQAATPGRVQVFKMTSDLLSYGTDVAAAEVPVPVDYKQKS